MRFRQIRAIHCRYPRGALDKDAFTAVAEFVF